ncbi:MAG: hypothetical protein ABFD16_18245, partial [Thermoguttaceae bacterium]
MSHQLRKPVTVFPEFVLNVRGHGILTRRLESVDAPNKERHHRSPSLENASMVPFMVTARRLP